MKMPHLVTSRKYRISVALLLADIILFNSVNPQQASAPWLIIGFGLLAVTIWSLVAAVSSWLFSQPLLPLGVQPRRLSRYLALLLTLLIGLQSVGQLTTKDTVALVPLLLGAYLYFGYGKRLASEHA